MAARLVTAALLTAVLAAPAASAAVDPAAEFADRVDRYVALRARLAAPLPPVDRPRAWSNLLARRYLASAVRTARSDARQGDVFTPPVAALFRERLAMLRPADRLLPGFAAADEGVPLLLVNEPLPEEWMTALPGHVLETLPSLPNGLAYRLVGTDLILWDAHAEIVVDVLAGAVP